MTHQSGIYEILNTVNGKRYIGSAVNLTRRRREHWAELKRNDHHCKHLQFAWNKYGLAAFEFIVLCVCATDRLTVLEQEWFDALKPEYNAAPVAGSPLGFKHPPEFGAAISARNKGRTFGPKSLETRQKLSAALKGRTLTIEHRAAVSRGMQGKKRGPLSLERRAEISKALTGVPHSLERRKKQSLAQTGKLRAPHTPEARKKISQALTGKHHPADVIAKRSLANKGKHTGPNTPEWGLAISLGKRGKPWSPARRAAQDKRSKL